MSTLQVVPLLKLSARPQVRKEFDPEKLAGLRMTIESDGLRQPPEVRASDEGFVVVSGERRFRSCVELAAAGKVFDPSVVDLEPKMESPIRVFVLSEEEAERAVILQFLENVQREDLTPEEEANGLRDLMAAEELTMAAAGDRIGKKKDWVSRRLALLDAPEEVLAALREGRISAAMAQYLGGLPESIREDVAVEVLEPMYGAEDETLTLREAQDLVARDFMRNLHRAAFPTDDETLNPERGKCTGCPLASTNGNVWRCMDPKCFAAKELRFLQRMEEVEGWTSLSAEEMERIFCGAGMTLPALSPWVALDSRLTAKDVGHVNGQEWQQLLREERVEVPVSAGIHPETQKLVRLIRRADAIAAVESKRRQPEEALKQTSSMISDLEVRPELTEGQTRELEALKAEAEKLKEKVSKSGASPFEKGASSRAEKKSAPALADRWEQGGYRGAGGAARADCEPTGRRGMSGGNAEVAEADAGSR